jgi:hypothetical protein
MGELLIWLVRVIIYTVIVRAVLRLIFPSRSANGSRGNGNFRYASSGPQGPRAAGPRPAAPPAERAGGTLVRDPQCGTYVAESSAIVVGSGADRVSFCSTDCRDRYLAARKAS